MICCLNPDCQSPLNPEDRHYCDNCKTRLTPLLRAHYRVIERLSVEGGFSITYLAEDIDKLNERCVVKQLAPKIQDTGMLQKAVKLFGQEAQRLQELGEHPQIPHLLAYFEQETYLYLVQQFIDGQNLLKELQQQGRFSEREIRQLLLDLLPVLKFIHERGVIHRDIKPQNIIRRQSDGRLVLIDFGASKLLTETVQPRMGTTIGSHGYTPMEQMEDGEAYPASDLFSLGATCFYLLSGISPSKLWMQQGYGWVGSWQQYFNSTSNGAVSLSMELGRVLDKLLKINIKERYQSADEVIKDLTGSLSPLPASEETILASGAKQASGSKTQARILAKPGKKFKNQLLTNAGILLLALVGIGYSQFRHISITELSNPSPSATANDSAENIEQASTLKGHASDVNSVTFSPDGQKLATGSDDTTIKLWNLATQEESLTLSGHSEWIWSIAFSPDGKTIASGSKDKTIKLWNVETGKKIRILTGHTGGIASVAFTPNGKILASGSEDKTIKLWDVETGKQIRTLTGHAGGIGSVAFSPNDKILASASWDKNIKLWDWTTGKTIRTLKGHSEIVMSVAFSPDGTSLASGSKDNTIKVWNLLTGENTQTLKDHTDKVNSVAFVPNTALSKSLNEINLVSGSNDNTIKLWNLKLGKAMRTLKKDSGYVYSVAISSDGQMIGSGGSAENIVKIWRMWK